MVFKIWYIDYPMPNARLPENMNLEVNYFNFAFKQRLHRDLLALVRQIFFVVIGNENKIIGIRIIIIGYNFIDLCFIFSQNHPNNKINV